MSNQLQAFIPPSDRDAEQALLGSILLNSKLLDEIAGKIRNEFFYDPRHRVVFTAMTHLWGANQPCDTLFVINQIQLQDKVAKAPSGIDQDFLLELISKSSLASSTDGLTKLIREKYLLRMLVNLGDDIKNLAGKQGETAAEILDEDDAVALPAIPADVTRGFGRGARGFAARQRPHEHVHPPLPGRGVRKVAAIR